MSQLAGPSSSSSNEEVGRFIALGVLAMAALTALAKWRSILPLVLHRLGAKVDPLLAEIGKVALPLRRYVLLAALAAAASYGLYRLWRSSRVRSALRSRRDATYLMLPTNTLSVSLADVLAFAEALGGTQRVVAVGQDRPARAVRFLFRSNLDSELECWWQVPSDAASALLTAGTVYGGGVEALPVEEEA